MTITADSKRTPFSKSDDPIGKWTQDKRPYHPGENPKSNWHPHQGTIGKGGSASTLKRMVKFFGRSRGNQSRRELSIEAIDGLLEHCVSLPLQERKKLIGLESDRADIIITGLSIIRILMRQAGGVSELVVNEGGVREGVMVDLIRKRSSGRHK